MEDKIYRKVRKIIAEVRAKGDAALIRCSRLFDGVDLCEKDLRVPGKDILTARIKDKALEEAYRKAILRVANFYKAEYKNFYSQKKLTFTSDEGIVTGEIFRPIERVGLYIPGGKYAYPSSLIMSAAPAVIAGVKEIAVCVPAKKVDEDFLGLAKLLGISEIYKIGGAQAIAAMAYGTKTVRPVDKIFGPGNIYVATAKKLVSGDVGIDGYFGPSEVCILTDTDDNFEYIKSDILSQLEHDEMAKAFVMGPSTLMERLEKDLELKEYFETGRIIPYSSGKMDELIDRVNMTAPEHLELLTKNNEKILSRIKNAGCIFLGKDSPVALGDYIAGPSHSLPTAGTARFSSGLSISDFFKRMSYIGVKKINKKIFQMAERIAEKEGLKAHAASLRIRI